MKRILHITGGMNRAGAETMVMNLYRAIDISKFQFDFLYFTDKICDFDHEIESMGGKIYRIVEPNPVQRFFALKNFLKSHQEFSIVHSHTLFNTGANLLAAKIAGVPHRIAHSHNTSDQSKNRFISNIYQTFSRFLIQKYATYYIACGQQASEFLFGHSVKSTLLYNAIDVDEYIRIAQTHRNYLKEKYKLDEDCMILIQVGRLEKVKNHSFSIEIMKYFKENGVNFKFFIIGQGTLKQEIHSKIEKLHLSEQVILTGVRDDVFKMMSGADAMLLPSFHEGFPVVLVEAQAVGLPSLIADTISKEVDLGLGLVYFQSLNVNLEIWANQLRNLKPNRNRDLILSTLQKKGFDVNNNSYILSSIYESFN